MTKEIFPTTNKKFIQSIKKSVNATKGLDKQLMKATKHLNNFIKPLTKSSKLSKPFTEMKKQVDALNQAIAENDLAGFQTILLAVGATFSNASIQSQQMVRSIKQVNQSYGALTKAFQGELTIDDASLISLDMQTKSLIQSFSNVQTIIESLKNSVTIDSSSLTALIDSGKQLTAEFSLMNQNILAFNDAFMGSQSAITSFSNTLESSLLSIDSSITNLVLNSGNLGNALTNAVKNPAAEVANSKNSFDQLKESLMSLATSFDMKSMNKVSSGISLINEQVSKGTGFFSTFTQSIIENSMGMVDTISKFGSSMMETGKHSTTSAKMISDTFGGIGNVLKGSANVGLTAMGSMMQGLTSVMGVAMKAIAPTALIGVALAALTLMDEQMNGQIGNMIQVAITKGPEIITGLVQGIISALPNLIASGAQLVAGFAEAIAINLPVIIQSAIALINTLVQGVIDSLPTLIPAALLLIESLATSLLSAAPQLLVTGLNLLLALVDGLLANKDQIVATVTNIIESFTTNITNNLPMILQKGIEILVKLAEGIASVLPQLIPVAFEAIATLVRTLSENLPTILNAAVEIVGKLCEGLLKNLPQILTAGLDLIFALGSGLLQAIPEILSTAGKIVLELIGALVNSVPELTEAGKNLIQGLIDGITGMAKAVVDAVKNIATTIGDKFKNIFNIHSPSRWMRDEIGAMLPAGLAIGIERNAHVVDQPMDDLASKIVLPSLDSLDQPVDSVQKLSIQSSSTQTIQKEKQPAIFNIQLGNQQFKAFVSDISEAMGQDSTINLAF